MTFDIYDAYERRFAEARAQKTLTHPWQQADREAILAGTKRLLRWDEKYLPQISPLEVISEKDSGTCRLQECRYETWPRVYGASSLYLPKTQGPWPLVFVCCGHGEQGRRTPSYAAMGRRLAELGMAAMVMDNLGQGDRNLLPEVKNRGHRQAVAPFYCGLTLQGLIVMETMALIRHMKADSRFDASRFAACGNSGGGTLTMFLAALCPGLSALASCGYPSELQYVLSKEKVHCSCNLLWGAAHGPDMWEIYSLFAPKPLLLSGGKWDTLFAPESVKKNARKVRNVYEKMDAAENFLHKKTDTRHSWEAEDLNLITDFLSRHLLGKAAEAVEAFPPQDTTPVPMPAGCMDAEQLAQELTGITMEPGTLLHQVFPPMFEGAPLNTEEFDEDTLRIFAQYESALSER